MDAGPLSSGRPLKIDDRRNAATAGLVRVSPVVLSFTMESAIITVTRVSSVLSVRRVLSVLFYLYTSQARKNGATLRRAGQRIVIVNVGESFCALRIRLHRVVDDIASPVGRVTHTLVGDCPGAVFGGDRSRTRCPDRVVASAVLVPRQYPERVAIKSGDTAHQGNVLARGDLGAHRRSNELDLASWPGIGVVLPSPGVDRVGGWPAGAAAAGGVAAGFVGS